MTEIKNIAEIGYKSKIDWARITLYIICGLIACYLILPILIVFPMSLSSAEFLTFPPPGFSLKWFQRYFSDPSWLQSTYMSLQIATLTMLLSSALGTLAAISLVRSRFWGKAVADGLILAPMIIPVVHHFHRALRFFFPRSGFSVHVSASCSATPWSACRSSSSAVSASLKGFDRIPGNGRYDLRCDTAESVYEDYLPHHTAGHDIRGTFRFYYLVRRNRDFNVSLRHRHPNAAAQNVGRHPDGDQSRHCGGVYTSDLSVGGFAGFC